MDPHISIEREFRSQGFEGWLLGCDEVGRGPLAGPATVACVAFPIDIDWHDPFYALLDDSKKLTEKKRRAIVPEIELRAAAFSVIDITPREIDERNILQACLWGMKRASLAVISALNSPENKDFHILVDGNKTIPNFDYSQTAFIKGDARSLSIAAASILAKVHRDDLMVAYDRQYPGYGFAKNVGYPTAAHRAALAELGPTPIHRQSFHVKK
ncbi:MAG: ribonuclease HII [Bradymonadales bacterium]|nr:ribonuclease HII [Bradymonadales bacterium]